MHITVVDPSRVALKYVAEMLLRGGHRVDTFSDATVALDHLTQDTSVEVLLTSLELEPISGIELCWRARLLASPHRPIHIIVMSSRDSDRTLAEALDSGADDFLVKPVSPEAIRARLRACERIMTLHRHLGTLAETDPLTGLLNRRAFFERIEELGRLDAVLPIVVCDVDHFKRVNDTYGHDAGDTVLREVARQLANIGQLAVRLGGEEFGIALPDQSMSDAMRIAERLRVMCASATFGCGDRTFSITSSFGVAGRTAHESIEAALKRADLALYRAKSSGRNQVVIEQGTLAEA